MTLSSWILQRAKEFLELGAIWAPLPHGAGLASQERRISPQAHDVAVEVPNLRGDRRPVPRPRVVLHAVALTHLQRADRERCKANGHSVHARLDHTPDDIRDVS